MDHGFKGVDVAKSQGSGDSDLTVVFESVWCRIQQSDNHARRSFEVTETILVDMPLCTDFLPSVRPSTVHIRPPIITFHVPSFKSVHDDQMSHVTYPEERMISKGLIQKQSENE